MIFVNISIFQLITLIEQSFMTTKLKNVMHLDCFAIITNFATKKVYLTPTALKHKQCIEVSSHFSYKSCTNASTQAQYK